MDDRGSVTILCAGLMVLLVAAAIGAVKVAEAEVLRQRAQSAADASALGAAHSPSLAPSAAAANGARVVRITGEPDWVEVEVERSGAHARARAARVMPAGGSAAAGLDPRVSAALRRAQDLLGRPVLVVSGYRSREEQEALWRARMSNPFPVAAPGSSAHERGLAVDLSVADAEVVAALRVGLCRPYANDPVHLELC